MCSLLGSNQILKHILFLTIFTPCITFGALDACILCEGWLLSDRNMTSLSCMSLLFLKHSLVVHSFHRIFILNLLNLIHELSICIFHKLIQLGSSSILKQRLFSYSFNIQSSVHHHHLCGASNRQNIWI